MLRCSAVGAPGVRSALWLPRLLLGPNLGAASPARSATSKAGGSTKNGRDSKPKFLGVKKYGGHWVDAGNIIVRQRGQRFGIVDGTATVAFARDWSIYALRPGFVRFWYHAMKKKYFVEVVRSAPGQALEKYPVVRVRSWEIPELLKIPADTPVSPNVRAQLLEYLHGIPPAQLPLVIGDRLLVGGVEREFRKNLTPTSAEGEGRDVDPAAADAAVAPTSSAPSAAPAGSALQ